MSMGLQRPAWLDEGLVLSTIGEQEALSFVIRRGTDLYVDAEERYERNRSESAVEELAAAGVTVALMNAHKCFALECESADIDSAVAFAERCHRHGIKVAVYIGETLGYEQFFLENPEAEDWLAVRYDGRRMYWNEQSFRLAPCKNHRGWIDFQKRITRMAIERIGADFLHYDNVFVWAEPDSCHCATCTRKFRRFLEAKYTPAERKRRLGFSDISGVRPPAYAHRGW